mmetsp:Transcript_6188/g.14929  ORF Transcript_6188/g.14929 Transcript_6188/m.14929 type:complete len:270 (-) Transcript_6188:134-943(-)
MLLGQGALAVLAVLVVLKSYHSWQANRWNKENQWQSRSWVDDEGLGFSRERSKSLINPPTNTANEISKAIALRYPKWLCREYLPFLQLKQEFSGRSHLCLPVLGTKLLSFSPLKEARKGSGYQYRVEGGLLADEPISGTLSFEFSSGLASGFDEDGEPLPSTAEIRTRLDDFRPRVLGTPGPLRDAIKQARKSSTKFTKKKPPKTLSEALSLGLPPNVEPQPWTPTLIGRWRRGLYENTQQRIHNHCLREFHKQCWKKYGHKPRFQTAI